MRRIISILALSLLLMGMLPLVLNFPSVKALTITVPGDYPTIQEALYAAGEGDTVFVRNGARTRPQVEEAGASIDLFTQKGGVGLSEPCPPFASSNLVTLYAVATYYQHPEQGKDVTFQVFDPKEWTFILFGSTNASGVAEVSFTLPSAGEPEDIFGEWRIVASTRIADDVVTDTLCFHSRWNLADIDGSLEVGIEDIVLMGAAYGSTSGSAGWNIQCDIVEPYGQIDINDVVFVCGEYGEKYNP